LARKHRQVESRMIAEYLKLTYSNFPYIINQPLGRVPEDLMKEVGYQRALGLTRPSRPIVDAVVILPRVIRLIEAKVWNVVNGLAKLPLYKELVPVTPELQQYMPRTVTMELVVGWTNPNPERMARAAGVTIKLYRPQWLEQVVEEMHNYWTTQYREERERKLRLREFFGVD